MAQFPLYWRNRPKPLYQWAQRFSHREPPHRTPVRRRPSIDFSITGLIYCSLMLFMGVAAVNSQANLLFGVFGLMIGILLIAGVISKMVMRKISIRRALPEHAYVGQPAQVSYEIANHKRFWPSLSLCLSELNGSESFVRQPNAYMLHVAATMTATVPIEVVPKRRGIAQLDTYQVSTSFPFGFVKRAAEHSHREPMLIFPAIGRVDRKLLQLCRSAEKTGATMRPRRGGQDEFYGVKQFRRGDNPRWIYWRRSARTGVLVSKEMTQVAPPRLALLVDTYIAPERRSRAEHARVERIIAMAASLASSALEAGMSVGLAGWNGDWVLAPPQRGKRHRLDLLGILARLPLNTVAPPQLLMDETHMLAGRGATPILFSPRPKQVALSDHLRSGLLVVSPESLSGQWFDFDAGVDFEHCMPLSQQDDLKDEDDEIFGMTGAHTEIKLPHAGRSHEGDGDGSNSSPRVSATSKPPEPMETVG